MNSTSSVVFYDNGQFVCTFTGIGTSSFYVPNDGSTAGSSPVYDHITINTGYITMDSDPEERPGLI